MVISVELLMTIEEECMIGTRIETKGKGEYGDDDMKRNDKVSIHVTNQLIEI